jgi:hypothetical protein
MPSRTGEALMALVKAMCKSTSSSGIVRRADMQLVIKPPVPVPTTARTPALWLLNCGLKSSC